MLWIKEWIFMDCRLIIDNWVRLSLRTIILDLGWRIYWTNCIVYIYFKINLRTSYYQRKVKEVVILKKVLITWMVIMSLVMPFGLIDTPEILIDLMNGVILLYLEGLLLYLLIMFWCIWITRIIMGSAWEWNDYIQS